jgi:hypothetical protein
MGSGAAPGWPASGRGRQGAAPLTSHHQGLGFRDFCRARGSQELMKKEEENCLPSPVARPGEGERRTVSLKTTLFCPVFFFFYMKRRRFIQNAPFHLNVAPANFFSNQSLIIFCLFQLHPFQFHRRPHIWPPFPLWSLVSDLCNLTLN